MQAAISAQLDALIGAYSPGTNEPVTVAVSGGSDSVALLVAAAHWAKVRGRRLVALTVDHRLRPTSTLEAVEVGRFAAAIGISHQILTWTDARPGQAAARDARHRLLGEASGKAGARVLLLGHTLDDVMETVLIRKRRRSPQMRLAGPAIAAPSPVWPQGRRLTLIRPLLGLRRAALREGLSSAGTGWVDDPSNEASAYERVRVRQFLLRHPDIARRLSQLTADLLIIREAADARLGQVLVDPAHVHADRFGQIELALTGLEPDLARRVMAVCLRVAAGHDRTPRAEAVGDLLDQTGAQGDRRTLAGAWVQRTRAGFRLGRDPGEADEPGGPSAGELWDGRYARDVAGDLPAELPVLVRASRPPGAGWRALAPERLALEGRAYQTLRVSPVQI